MGLIADLADTGTEIEFNRDWQPVLVMIALELKNGEYLIGGSNQNKRVIPPSNYGT